MLLFYTHSYSKNFKTDTVFPVNIRGNPALRSETGSVYLQHFFSCLRELHPKNHDIHDLQRWLNQCLTGIIQN